MTTSAAGVRAFALALFMSFALAQNASALTIGFEQPTVTAGQVVDTQYASQGVRFGSETSLGTPSLQGATVAGPPGAVAGPGQHAGTQLAQIVPISTSEGTFTATVIALDAARSQVSFYIGGTNFGPGTATAVAYDQSGTAVDEEAGVTLTATADTEVTLSTPGATIRYVQIKRISGSGAVFLDDLMVPDLPDVGTDLPADVTSTSATLKGHVNPMGNSVSWFFEISPGGQVGFGNLSGVTNQNVTASATSLTPGTAYSYRIVVNNGGTYIYGANVPFSTPPVGATPPNNTAAPAIQGTPKAGQQISVTNGTWTSAHSLTYTYLWQRCVAGVCSVLSGQTGSTLDVTPAMAGGSLRAVVTARDATDNVEASAQSNAVDVPNPPALNGQVTIGGTVAAGHALTLTTPESAWTGTGSITFAYQWERCRNDVCDSIAGKTESYLTLDASLVGYQIRLVVRATDNGGTTTAASVLTGPVTTTDGGLRLAVAPVSLGDVYQGITRTRLVVVVNPGGTQVLFTLQRNIESGETLSKYLKITTLSCGQDSAGRFVIEANASCTLRITVSLPRGPVTFGTPTLFLSGQTSGGILRIPVTGSIGKLSLVASPLDFGDLQPGVPVTRVLTLTSPYRDDEKPSVYLPMDVVLFGRQRAPESGPPTGKVVIDRGSCASGGSTARRAAVRVIVRGPCTMLVTYTPASTPTTRDGVRINSEFDQAQVAYVPIKYGAMPLTLGVQTITIGGTPSSPSLSVQPKCPASYAKCSLVMSAYVAVSARASALAKARRGRLIGQVRLTLGKGQTRKARLKLTAAGRAALKGKRRVPIIMVLRVRAGKKRFTSEANYVARR